MSRRHLIRVVYLTALVVLAVSVVATRRDELSALTTGADWTLLVATLLLSAVPPAITTAYWWMGLKTVGAPSPYGRLGVVTLRSLMARYLPGGVWYAASRVVLLERKGTRRSLGALVASTELAMTILVAVAVGVPLVALGSGRTGLGWGLAALAAVALAVGQPLVSWLASRLNREGGGGLPASAYARLVITSVAYWLALSATFVVFMRAFPALDRFEMPLVAGAYMVGWVTGWLAPFAPQGLGVFEVAVASMLDTSNVAELALVAAGLRAVFLVRDLAGTALGEGINAWNRRRGGSPRVG